MIKRGVAFSISFFAAVVKDRRGNANIMRWMGIHPVNHIKQVSSDAHHRSCVAYETAFSQGDGRVILSCRRRWHCPKAGRRSIKRCSDEASDLLRAYHADFFVELRFHRDMPRRKEAMV